MEELLRDPAVGRFISEDPITFVGGINFYRYVSNDPTDLWDPLGLCKSLGPCDVPLHPAGVDVDSNIFEARIGGPLFQFVMVLPSMPWDYKRQGPYDDFGNFNFGATGAALGYPDQVLLRGAGALKVLERSAKNQPAPPGIGSPLGDYPHGNEPEKQQMIQAGIDYFKHHCMGLGKFTQIGHISQLPIYW